jgi:hypothetical protein
MEALTNNVQVPPAEEAWDDEETLERPRPGYARVSAPVGDWSQPGPDEANSDLGNSGRDLTVADDTALVAPYAA